MGLVALMAASTMTNATLLAAGYPNPQPGGNDPVDVPFAAGAYVIDAGTVSPGASVQTVGQGLKPYGLIYALIKARIPVQWVINPAKTSSDASGVSVGGIGQTLGNNGIDFTFDCDAAGTKYTARDFTTGAFVVAKEFVAQAKPVIDTFRSANGGQPMAGTIGGVAQTGQQIFGYDPTAGQTQGCSNGTPTLPVFATIAGWPRTALDAQNGSIAVGFFVNAGIPQGPINVPSNPPAYRFASPSQLTSCDDFYAMPHADPTYATHQNLKAFNDQGGYMWAGCHAVSVLENVRVNDSASSPLYLNFLSTDGLLSYKDHDGGSVPYAFYKQTTDTKPYYSPTYGTTALDAVLASDPIAQFRGRTDLAQQNGSEQIFMPGYGGTPSRTSLPVDTSTASKWRPTTQVVVYDPTQKDVYPLTSTAAPLESLGPAASVVYGRGFGGPTNGLVVYEGGHSINKGSADDVAAQRVFFNAQLLAGVERTPKVAITAPTAGAAISGNTTVPVAGSATGGSGSFSYTWSASCTDAVSGAEVGGGSFANSASATTTFTTPSVTGQVNCNLALSVVDSCGRTAFAVQSVVVVPAADVQVTKTGPAAASVGSVNYNIVVTNNGSGTATAVVLSDPAPAGSTYAAASYSVAYATPSSTPVGGLTNCSVTAGVLNCTLGNLAVNQTATIAPTVTAPVGGVTLNNTATVSASSPDPNPSNNTSSVTTTIVSSDLTVVKTASPTLVPSGGGAVTFGFSVTNNGDNPLSNVAVTDAPTCAVTGPSGDANMNNLLDVAETWVYQCTRTVNNLTVDTGTAAFPHDVGPFASSTKQDVVTVTAKDQADNTVSSSAAATVTISSPAITVTKTLAPSTQRPGPGDLATFEIVVTNTGNVPLTNVAAVDPWSGGCAVSEIPDLAVGASYSYICAATVPAVLASASDSFPVVGASDTVAYQQGSGWVSEWIDSQDTSASGGDIRIIVPPIAGATSFVAQLKGNRTFTRPVDLASAQGATLSLRYARTKEFNRDSEQLRVQFSADGVTFVDIGSIIGNGIDAVDAGWTSASFEVGAAQLAAGSHVRFESTSGDEIYLDDVSILVAPVNSVTVSANDVLGTPVTAIDTEPVILGSPTMAITKSASPAFVHIGETLTYTVTVTNTASVAQSNVAVSDPMPAGLGNTTYSATLPSVSSIDDFDSGVAYDGGSGWRGGWVDLQDADPASGDIRITAPSSPTPTSAPNVLDISNGKDVYRDAFFQGYTSATLSFTWWRPANYNNNARSLVVEVSGDGGATYLPALLTITGTGVNVEDPSRTLASLAVPPAALTDQFRLRFRSTGGAEDIEIDSVSVVADPAALSSLAPISLRPGGAVTYTITSDVVGAPVDGFQFSNLAVVTSTQMPAPVAAAASTPFYAPSYSITKAASPTTLLNGGATTYTVTLSNTGNVALTRVSVSDPSCTLGPLDGDLNVNNQLELGETWVYTCTRVISSTDGNPSTPDIVPNTVSASFTDPSGLAVNQNATADVTVIHPALTIAASPPTATIYSGGTVPYTYTATNTGDVALTNVVVAPDNCAAPVYASGDDGDGVMQPGESWLFSCTTGAIGADQSAQEVKASAQDSLLSSSVISNTVQVAVDVINPALSLVKTATNSGVGDPGPGDALTVAVTNSIDYHFAATNTGDTQLTEIAVSDDTCSPVVYASGDAGGDNVMSMGETWQFSCAAGQLERTTTNVATASGRDLLLGLVQSDPDSAIVTVLAPELQLQKSPSTDYVTVGGSVGYTFSVSNTGGTDIVSFTPADDDPRCTLARGPDAPGNNDAVLEMGETWIYTCTVNPFNSDTLDIFTVTNVIDSLGYAGYTPTPAVALVFAIDPRLSVVKQAITYVGASTTVRSGPADAVGAAVGDTAAYTYAVSAATGPTASPVSNLNSLVDLAVADDKCAPVLPVLDDAGTPGNPTDDFNIGDTDNVGQLDPDETWHYTCTSSTVTASPGDVINIVTAGARSSLDDNPASPTPIASLTATDTAKVSTYDPKFAISKEIAASVLGPWQTADAAPGPFFPAGSTAFFRYVITNTGNTSLRIDSVVDDKGLVVSCPGGPLPVSVVVGDSLTCSASGPIAAGQYTNVATVDAQPLDVDNNPIGESLQGSDAANAFGSAPALTLAKSPSPTTVTAAGQTVDYSFLVTNNGNVTLTSVGVSDPLPDLSVVSCPVSSLAPNASTTCTASYTAKLSDMDAGSIVNTATASGTPPVGEPVTDMDSATVTAATSPSILLVKSASPTTVTAAGQTVNYSFLVTNNGNVTLTSVGVSDPLADLSVVSCPVSSLAPNASTTCTASYTVKVSDMNAGSIENTATASGTPPGTNPVPVTDTDSTTVTATQSPSITVEKSASPTTVTAAGQTVNYSFLVTNNGNVTLTSVAVTDPLPDLSVVTCPLTTLDPAQSTTCTASYTVKLTDINAGSIVNTATVSGDPPSGPPVTNTSSTTVPAPNTPGITIVKSSTEPPYTAVGQILDFTLTATNTGNVTLTNVTITDAFAVLGTCDPVPPVTLAPGESLTCAASHAVTQADLDHGSFENVGATSGTTPQNTTVSDESNVVTIPATQSPTVTLSKATTSTSFSAVGQQIPYTITALNSGNVTLVNVVITDPNATMGTCTPASPATLAPGQSMICNAVHTVTASDLSAGRVTNTAQVAAGSGVLSITRPSNEVVVPGSPAVIPSTGGNIIDSMKMVSLLIGGGLTLLLVSKRRPQRYLVLPPL